MVDILAMIASLLGAFIMTKGSPKLIPYAMVCYITGSILWIFVGINMDMISLILTNVVFIILEVIALYKWVNYNEKHTGK